MEESFIIVVTNLLRPEHSAVVWAVEDHSTLAFQAPWMWDMTSLPIPQRLWRALERGETIEVEGVLGVRRLDRAVITFDDRKDFESALADLFLCWCGDKMVNEPAKAVVMGLHNVQESWFTLH